MNKLYAENISIEITRRCNMACAHCMRGDAEDTDIDHRHIRNLLKHFSAHPPLQHYRRRTFTQSRAIFYILKQLKNFDIRVDYFDVVTNGSLSSISQAFIDTCSALYEYQKNKDQDEFNHMLEMSDDRFHNNQNRTEVTAVLNRYPFFGMRGQDGTFFLFKEGRCVEGYPNPRTSVLPNPKKTKSVAMYTSILRGEILSNGNLSYLRQRDNVLCKKQYFLKYLKTTLKKEIYMNNQSKRIETVSVPADLLQQVIDHFYPDEQAHWQQMREEEAPADNQKEDYDPQVCVGHIYHYLRQLDKLAFYNRDFSANPCVLPVNCSNRSRTATARKR